MRIHLERVAVVTATPHTTWTFAVLGDGEIAPRPVEVTVPDRSEGSGTGAREQQ